LARKTAAEKDIDYRQIQGSGPSGRIIKSDVLDFKPSAQPLKQEVSQDVKTDVKVEKQAPKAA